MSEYAEESVTIEGPLRLEGRLSRVSGEEGLVVTHPHPLYGGSMDNNVVKALVRAGKEVGMSTLRFNFRGVGGSQGTHGRGPAERDDLRAALEMLAAEGVSRLVVAGYSFGAWVAATADYGGLPVAGCVWVAPPVGMMPLKPGQVTRAPDLVGLRRPGLLLPGGGNNLPAEQDRSGLGAGPAGGAGPLFRGL